MAFSRQTDLELKTAMPANSLIPATLPTRPCKVQICRTSAKREPEIGRIWETQRKQTLDGLSNRKWQTLCPAGVGEADNRFFSDFSLTSAKDLP